jgi:hypothetical protein
MPRVDETPSPSERNGAASASVPPEPSALPASDLIRGRQHAGGSAHGSYRPTPEAFMAAFQALRATTSPAASGIPASRHRMEALSHFFRGYGIDIQDFLRTRENPVSGKASITLTWAGKKLFLTTLLKADLAARDRIEGELDKHFQATEPSPANQDPAEASGAGPLGRDNEKTVATIDAAG